MVIFHSYVNVYQRVVFLEFSEWIFSGGKPCHSCGWWKKILQPSGCLAGHPVGGGFLSSMWKSRVGKHQEMIHLDAVFSLHLC